MVRQQTIDFLGHPPVKASQSGFNVDNRYVQFGSGKRSGQRRIGIAIYQNGTRMFRRQNVLDLL
jgi:hypothetical protein